VQQNQEHDQRAAVIAAQVAERAASGQRVHITKKSVHHVVPLPGDRRFSAGPVDISSLSNIIHIDAAGRTCTCEPGVTFRELVQATLNLGLIPTVVPELEGITVGGAVAGCSVEAMSFRFGGFHDSCLAYELIDGQGQVRRCSPAEDPELFHMIHGSYGTLGILSQVTFKLIPASPFVRMEYRHLPSYEAFHEAMSELCNSDAYDFIDGIIHSPRQLTLCLGKWEEDPPYVSDYTLEEIYYKSTARRTEDYLRTEEYCFRYDTECHWLSRTIPPLEWRPVRRLLGKHLLGSTNMITWSNRLGRIAGMIQRRPDVVCDVFIPLREMPRFWDWYEQDFDFYPLWIVPYRVKEVYPWVADEFGRGLEEAMADDLIIDCAVYGRPNRERGKDYSRMLQEKTHELYGIKTLISRNHYDTPDDFWHVYNRKNIEAAKERADPRGVFPGLYETFGLVE